MPHKSAIKNCIFKNPDRQKTGMHDEKHGHPPFQDYFEPRREP